MDLVFGKVDPPHNSYLSLLGKAMDKYMAAHLVTLTLMYVWMNFFPCLLLSQGHPHPFWVFSPTSIFLTFIIIYLYMSILTHKIESGRPLITNKGSERIIPFGQSTAVEDCAMGTNQVI